MQESKSKLLFKLLQAKWSLKSSRTEWAEKVITEVEFKDSKVRKKVKTLTWLSWLNHTALDKLILKLFCPCWEWLLPLLPLISIELKCMAMVPQFVYSWLNQNTWWLAESVPFCYDEKLYIKINFILFHFLWLRIYPKWLFSFDMTFHKVKDWLFW